MWEEGLSIFKENVKHRIHDDTEQRDLDLFLTESRSPEDARNITGQIKTEASMKYGKITSDGKTIDEKWINNIMSNIQNFITIGDFVMTKAPESVGAAWFGVSMALSAIQSKLTAVLWIL